SDRGGPCGCRAPTTMAADQTMSCVFARECQYSAAPPLDRAVAMRELQRGENNFLMVKSKAPTSMSSAEMMDTREVAAYLRLKERRIYDLARSHAIPHVRATGKLLFPRRQIDEWLAVKSGNSTAT